MKVLALSTLMLLVTCVAYGVVEPTDKLAMHDYRILVTQGRVVEKTVLLEGKTTAVPAVNITQAMSAEGKVLNMLQNRTLRVIGPLAKDVLALRGQEVVVRGIVRKNRFLEVTWIEEKKEASRNIHAPTPVW